MIKQNKTPSRLEAIVTALIFTVATTFYGEYVISRGEMPDYLVAVCTLIEVFALAYTMKTVFGYVNSIFNKPVTNKKQKK